VKCLKCKSEIENDADYCTECGTEMPINSIGGLLIFVGLGVVFSPLIMLAQIFPMYSDVFKPGVWDLLTTPGTEYYVQNYSIVLIGEMSINALVLITSLYMIYLFFSRKTLFKKVYIGLAIFTPIFLLVDAIVVQQLLDTKEMFDNDIVKELFKSILTLCIWVPYMIVSKRAKRTFIN